MRMRLRWALVSGIGLCLACASLSPADPSASFAACIVASNACGGGRIEVTIDGGFKPTRLSKKKLAPAHFRIEETIGMADGSNPPPLRELVLEIDRNAALNARGLPACGLGKIKNATTSQALKACRPALVGEGAMVVSYFERSSLFPKEKLLVFNGGSKDGRATIYIHTYLMTPISAPLVMTAMISKVHRGRYGTKLAISVPLFAEGSGFIKKFQLEFFRRFAYKQKKQSFVRARCFDGKLQAKAASIFSEGPPVVGVFWRSCTTRS